MSAREAHTPAERCLPDDPFFDYLLLPYAPPRPAAGKLRSVNLLLASFGLMGVAEQGRRVVAGLGVQQLGPFMSGIKHTPTAPEPLSWELYFYRRDSCRGEPTLEGVLGALAPHLQVSAQLGLPPRWEMFSLEWKPRTWLRAVAASSTSISACEPIGLMDPRSSSRTSTCLRRPGTQPRP